MAEIIHAVAEVGEEAKRDRIAVGHEWRGTNAC